MATTPSLCFTKLFGLIKHDDLAGDVVVQHHSPDDGDAYGEGVGVDSTLGTL